MRLLSRFRRITSTGSYLPEVDGLRFLAILWVFVFHLNDYLIKIHHGSGTNMLQRILGNGHLGVELFFVISGFVLSLPFARYHFEHGKRVSMKQYFIRRLTRLEPPYFLIMTALFFFLATTRLYTINGLIPHLMASLLYVHNIIYPGTFPTINSVAWSLEIEIQFYIMVPLLARVYVLQKNLRRVLFVTIMIILPLIQYYYKSETLFFYQFLQYFCAGFLLADVYVNSDKWVFYKPANKIKRRFLAFGGVVLFLGILLVESSRTDLIYSILIAPAIFSFYCIVLFTPFWKKVFSQRFISIVGGMSYTIYLIHLPVISTFGRFFVQYGISAEYPVYFILQFCFLGLITMLFSCLFFYFIERPCMRKGWYNKLYKSAKV